MSKTLGQRIRAARLARRLTQNELSDLVSVQPTTVSRWERDECDPQGYAKQWLREMWGVLPDPGPPEDER